MQDANRVVRVAGWLLWLGVVAAWSVGLLIPDPEVTATAGLVSKDPETPAAVVLTPAAAFSLSKTCHIFLYGLLLGSLTWLPASPALRYALLAFLSLHAGTSEYLQQFVEGRSGCFQDVVLDHVGMALGFALTWRRWSRAAGCWLSLC